MPKQRRIYKDFSGGLNDSTDPRDIAANEVSDISNMMTDRDGRIRSMGSVSAVSGITGTFTGETIQGGRGLFAFRSDWKMGSKTISTVVDNGGTARFNTSATHGLATGDVIFHVGFTVSGYNGYKTVTTIVDGDTYETGDTYVSTDTGTAILWNDSTQTAEWYLVQHGLTNYMSLMPVSLDKWMKNFVVASDPTYPVYYYVSGVLRMMKTTGATGSNWVFTYLDYGHYGGTDFDTWYKAVAAMTQPSYKSWYVMDYDAMTGTAQAGSDQNTLVLATNYEYTAADLADGYLWALSDTDNECSYIQSRVANNTVDTDNLSVSWLGDTYHICPGSAIEGLRDTAGFVVGLKDTAGGTWQLATNGYEFAESFIYGDGQETQPKPLYWSEYYGKTHWTPADDTYLTIRIHAASGMRKTLRGARIYYRDVDAKGDWKLFIDIDLDSGIRSGHLGSDYTAWTTLGAYTSVTAGQTAPSFYYAEINIYDPPVITFEDLNGFSQTETLLAPAVKAAVVVGKRTFIANVYDSTDAIWYGDRIMYTPVGRYDTFPKSYRLELGINDGDEFTALATFSDRLLAFKKHKLYIINVSHGSDTGWYLESQHDALGVIMPAAVFSTDRGVIWVNENGCYIYDGTNLVNLVQKPNYNVSAESGKGGHVAQSTNVDEDTWSSFITDYAIVGYEPNMGQVIVVGDTTATTGTVYIYDLATKAWARGTKFSQSAADMYSNFALYDNKLIFGHNE